MAETRTELNIDGEGMSLRFNLSEVIREGYNEACAPESGKQWHELTPMERKHFFVIANGCINFVMDALNDEDSPIEAKGELILKEKA